MGERELWGEREQWGAWNMNGTASVVFQLAGTRGGGGGNAPSTSPFLPCAPPPPTILQLLEILTIFAVLSLAHRHEHTPHFPKGSAPRTLQSGWLNPQAREGKEGGAMIGKTSRAGMDALEGGAFPRASQPQGRGRNAAPPEGGQWLEGDFWEGR